MINSIRLIKNALHTPHTLFTLLKNVKKQKLFLQKNIQPQLEAAENTNDGSLDESELNPELARHLVRQGLAPRYAFADPPAAIVFDHLFWQ